MGVTEVVGFVTGAVCVWLAVRQNSWTWPIGIANNVAFAVLFVGAGLYAGAGLQVVYLALGVHGWVSWLRGGPEGRRLAVRRTPRWGWAVGAASAAALTAVLWVVLAATDDPAPLADAATTGLALVAQVMLNRKWLGTWWVWIVTDVALVALFASQGLWLTAVLYAGFTALCVQGLRRWGRELSVRADDAPAPVAAPTAA